MRGLRFTLTLALGTAVGLSVANCGGASDVLISSDASAEDGSSSSGASSSGSGSSSGGATSSGSGGPSSSGGGGSNSSGGGPPSSSSSGGNGSSGSSGGNGSSSSSSSSSGGPIDAGRGDTGTTDAGQDAGSACNPACTFPETCCGGRCVDPYNDPYHCGGCDTVCKAPASLCEAGKCIVPPCNGQMCGLSQLCCGSSCCNQQQLCCAGATSIYCYTPTSSQPTCPH